MRPFTNLAMFAICFMGFTLIVICIECFMGINRDGFGANIDLMKWQGIPWFIGVPMYAMSTPGVPIPIRNQCENPKTYRKI